jgi:pentatricopeptide repeat protein
VEDNDVSPQLSRKYRDQIEHMIAKTKELLAIPTLPLFEGLVDLHHHQAESLLGRKIQSYTSPDAILPPPESPKRSSLSVTEPLMEAPAFYHEQYEQSTDILQSILQNPQRRMDLDPARSSLPNRFDSVKWPWTGELITLALQLHHRVITEFALLDFYAERFPDDPDQRQWIDHRPKVLAHRTYCTNIRNWNRLLNLWKDVTLGNRASPTRAKALPSVRQVLDHTLYMTTLFPNGSTTFPFRYDMGTICILLQVLIPQLPSKFSAPLDVEEFVRALQAAAERIHPLDLRQQYMLRCDSYLYSILMKVWADSGRPETAERLVSLLQQMRAHSVPPNAVIYSILLRYYGGCGAVEQVQSLLQRMEEVDGIPPTLACYAQAVYCLANADQLPEARRLLDRMIAQRKSDPRATSLLVSAAHNILDAYRRSLDAYGSQSSARGEAWDQRVQDTIEQAAALVRRLESTGVLVLDEKFGDSVRGTLMDIYARAGTEEHLAETQRLFQKMVRPDTIAYGILIKAYRKNHRADLADATLQKLLQDARVPNLSINIFNSVIHAWAESTLPNAVQSGLNVLHFIKNMNKHCMIHVNPKSRTTLNKEILPNADTYNALLKCLAEAGDGVTFPQDVGMKAEGLILQMERRYRGGDDERGLEVLDYSCQPSFYTYTTGIRACLRVNDFDHAESILRRMEISSTTPPNTAVYNMILNHYVTFCHGNAVKLTMSTTPDQDGDDAATMKASVMALNTKAARRATKILKYMILSEDPSTQPDMVSYNRVLQCWTKSYHGNADQEIWDIYQAFCRPKRGRNQEDSIQNYMNSVCYDTMISFFTTESSDEDAIQKALLLVRSLETSSQPDLRPDGWHYLSIIKGFARLGFSGTASATLMRVMERSDSQVMNIIPALLHTVTLSWIEQDQLEIATQCLEDFLNVWEQKRSDPSVPIGTEAVVPPQWNVLDAFQALRAAWMQSQHPNKDAFLATLEVQMKLLPRSSGAAMVDATEPQPTSLSLPQQYEALPSMNY